MANKISSIRHFHVVNLKPWLVVAIQKVNILMLHMPESEKLRHVLIE
jgi:hypothetical protein